VKNVMAVILAGGKGARLEPLTRDRAKPAVPFGGQYRIIDFTLSNCLNSGVGKIAILTQYKSMSLERHVNLGWRRYFRHEFGEFLDVIPPQQRIDESWYQGTADAVYQNIYVMERERPEYVVILAGDHIYKMNYAEMVDFHIRRGAELTVGALRVPREECRHFGIIEVDPENKITGFEEKPIAGRSIPGDEQHCLASMGIYVFSTRFLFEQLLADAVRQDSSHDFGKNIIPSIVNKRRVFAFRFQGEASGADAYWRDVGTLDAYYQANMDLVAVTPQLNLYEPDWPIRTFHPNFPPPKFVFGSREDSGERRGEALDSIVCPGAILSGGTVRRCILGPQVRINSYSQVDDSILFDGVQIGRGARVRRAIIDKGVTIPPGEEVGYDLDADRRRGYTLTDDGVVVIPKAGHLDELARDLGQ